MPAAHNTVFTAANQLDGWTLNFAQGSSTWNHYMEVGGTGSWPTAADGSFYLNLTIVAGNGQTQESLSQGFPVTQGIAYTVSFSDMARQSNGKMTAGISLLAGSASGTLTTTTSGADSSSAGPTTPSVSPRTPPRRPR